jgi:hypothetical protein
MSFNMSARLPGIVSDIDAEELGHVGTESVVREVRIEFRLRVVAFNASIRKRKYHIRG